MISLNSLDKFFLGCFIGDILTTTILHTIIRTFINNKPEGKKTVISKIYITSSYAIHFFTISVIIPICFRIIFGPFTIEVLFPLKIVWTVTFNAVLCLLVSSVLIKVFFLVDYGRMFNIAEGIIISIINRTTTFWVIGGLFIEFGWKWFMANTFMHRPLMIYLGHQNSHGKIPDFSSFANINFFLLVLSLLILFILKAKARFVGHRRGSMTIMETIRLDNPDHGITLNGTILSAVVIGSINAVENILWIEKSSFSAYADSPAVVLMALSLMTILSLLPGAWILVNAELREYSGRKLNQFPWHIFCWKKDGRETQRARVYRVETRPTRGNKLKARNKVGIEQVDLNMKCNDVKIEVKMEELHVRGLMYTMKMKNTELTFQNMAIMEEDVKIEVCDK